MLSAFRLWSECYRGIVGEILRFGSKDSGSFRPTQGHNARNLRLIGAAIGFVGRDEERLTAGASRDHRSQLVELGTFVLLRYQPCQLIAPNTVRHKRPRLTGHSKSQFCLVLVPLLTVRAATGAGFFVDNKIEHPRLTGRHGLLIIEQPVPLHQRLGRLKGIWPLRLDSPEAMQNIVVSMR